MGPRPGTAHSFSCSGTNQPNLLSQVIQLNEEKLSVYKTEQVISYLRMATVSASGELAQGQMTSGLSPLAWKTLRNASQEDMDPA